jgi:hypothetical protein
MRATAELLGGTPAKRLAALPDALRMFFRYWEK